MVQSLHRQLEKVVYLDSQRTNKAFVQMAKWLEQTSGHNECCSVPSPFLVPALDLCERHTYFCKLGLEKQFYEASDKFDVVSTLFSLMALLSAELRYTANEWQRQRNSSNGTALKALSRPYIKL